MKKSTRKIKEGKKNFTELVEFRQSMEQKKNILRTNSSVFGTTFKWFSVNSNCKQTFGSAIAVQKLRESKWFGIDESRVLCAVVECGFIVETFQEEENLRWYGVVVCKTSRGEFYFLFRFVIPSGPN